MQKLCGYILLFFDFFMVLNVFCKQKLVLEIPDSKAILETYEEICENPPIVA